MNSDFAAAMRRATDAVRAQRLGEATAIIQAALAGRSPPGAEPTDAGAEHARPELSAETATPPAGGEAGGTARAGATGRPDGVRGALREVAHGLRDRRLGAVISGLRHGVPGRHAPSPPAVPEGAAFLERAFSCQAGTRRYRLYVPACARTELRGLIVMLHGCTQTPEDFALGTRMNARAEADRLLIAYPRQTRRANASSCWNWFAPADQQRHAGEPAIIAGLTREIVAEFAIPRERVFVAGLSAGGAMAMVMAQTHPELYAAVGVHSGLPYGAASDARSALAAMRGQDHGQAGGAPAEAAGPPARVIVFHGNADRTVHPSNAERIVAAARAAQPGNVPLRAERRHDANGRICARAVLDDGDGRPAIEFWRIDGAGHAWAGGDPAGSFTDPAGPDASAEMIRFFLS